MPRPCVPSVHNPHLHSASATMGVPMATGTTILMPRPSTAVSGVITARSQTLWSPAQNDKAPLVCSRNMSALARHDQWAYEGRCKEHCGNVALLAAPESRTPGRDTRRPHVRLPPDPRVPPIIRGTGHMARCGPVTAEHLRAAGAKSVETAAAKQSKALKTKRPPAHMPRGVHRQGIAALEGRRRPPCPVAFPLQIPDQA